MKTHGIRRRCILFCGAGMLLVMWIGLQGCDKEETSSGLKGIVTVEGTDADRVVVRLFNRPNTEDEASVWSVPGQHSSIGFTYQTQTVYDHRVDWQIDVDTTDAEGRFDFGNVNSGDYIVVADGDVESVSGLNLKKDYGWSRAKDVRVDAGVVDIGTLQLFPDTVLGITTVTSQMTISAGRHWVLLGTFIISSGGSVTVEPGAVIRLINNGRIQVNAGGQLICNGSPDSFILITTDDIVQRDPAEWRTIKFLEGAAPPQFSYCRIEYAQTAIETYVDGGEISNCFLKSSVESVRAYGLPPAFRRNVVQRVGTGFFCGSISGTSIENCLFQSCDPFSIALDGATDGHISCNWFRDGGGSDTSTTGGTRGVIKMDHVSSFDVFQNSFETSWYALSLGSNVDSSVYIHHNTFHRMNTVLYVGVTNDRLRRSNPRFNYNCMTSVAGHFLWITSCQINNVDIHAEYNLWNGQMDRQYIHERLVWDCVNQPSTPSACPCFLFDDDEILSSCGQIKTLTGTLAGICEDL